MNGAWLGGLLLVAGTVWMVCRFIVICEAANQADWGGKWLNRLDGLNRLFCRRFHGLPGETLPLPDRGAVLVASNHVSGLDPLLLIAASRRPLRFIIAQEQYDRWYLRWLFQAVGCIPIARERDPRRALYAARRALGRGEVVALFPYGRILLDHQPPVPLKRGIVLLSHMSSAPIVPVRISGVRGQGFTVRAVFMRSRARLEKRPLLRCKGHSIDWCMQQLSQALHSGPPARSEPHITTTS
jgi:1-acyl-sn-glycerol-3-phosphate acyltransferase